MVENFAQHFGYMACHLFHLPLKQRCCAVVFWSHKEFPVLHLLWAVLWCSGVTKSFQFCTFCGLCCGVLESQRVSSSAPFVGCAVVFWSHKEFPVLHLLWAVLWCSGVTKSFQFCTFCGLCCGVLESQRVSSSAPFVGCAVVFWSHKEFPVLHLLWAVLWCSGVTKSFQFCTFCGLCCGVLESQRVSSSAPFVGCAVVFWSHKEFPVLHLLWAVLWCTGVTKSFQFCTFCGLCCGVLESQRVSSSAPFVGCQDIVIRFSKCFI